MYCCGRAAIDLEPAREPESGHAVDQPEVDGLRLAPLVRVHRLERHAEDLRGGGLVHVAIFGESLEQAGIVGQVRHDAQLDLRIVRRHQHVAGRRR